MSHRGWLNKKACEWEKPQTCMVTFRLPRTMDMSVVGMSAPLHSRRGCIASHRIVLPKALANLCGKAEIPSHSVHRSGRHHWNWAVLGNRQGLYASWTAECLAGLHAHWSCCLWHGRRPWSMSHMSGSSVVGSIRDVGKLTRSRATDAIPWRNGDVAASSGSCSSILCSVRG